MEKAKYKIGDRVVITGVTDHRRTYNGKIVNIEKVWHSDVHKTYCYSVGKSYYFLENELKPIGNKIVITTDGTETLARLYEGNKVIKTATAKCSPADKFDALIGAKIAFDRLVENKPADKWRVVKRSVKAGDFIRLIDTPYSFNRKGDILRADRVDGNNCYVCGDKHPRLTSNKNVEWCYNWYDYEVVEPITPEEKPKYYNGKAVCVKCKDHDYTVGKVYEVVNGKLKDDKGNIRPHGYALKELSDYSNTTAQYEFIPLVE